MPLPFDEGQFLRVFAGYNTALWPVVLLLWLVSVAAALAWLTRRRLPDSWLVVLLMVLWAWSGIAYHLVFFTRINPAAYLFGALFVFEAAALGWYGLVTRRLRFATSSPFWGSVGAAFVVYAIAYPLITDAVGFDYPRMATFGVPCPTTLLTVGLLLATSPPAPRLAVVIPFIWTVVGGSAAVLLDVYPDWALLVAALALLSHSTLSREHSPANAG